MSFAEKIKAFRRSTNLSQKDFADKIGVPYRTYQTIEQGGTERIEVPALIKLGELGANIMELIGAEHADFVHPETPTKRTDSGPATPKPTEAELLLMEFGAWLRRTVLKNPELIDDIATGIRRLINEVEEKRLPRAAPQDDVGEKMAS